MCVAFSILRFLMNYTFGDISHVNTIYKLVPEYIATEHRF
jgi:hypothetical protein